MDHKRRKEMNRVSWYSIIDLCLILTAVILITMTVGCRGEIPQPDPQMGPNAITLDEPTIQSTDRFEKVYSSLADQIKIEVYRDRDHPSCELIIVTIYNGLGGIEQLDMQYVDHNKMRFNL
jgi:hypothetical protein